MVHANIVGFLTTQLTNAGFQPICQGISSFVSDIPGEGVLHIGVASVLFVESIVIKLTLFRPGFCFIGHPEHAVTHVSSFDFASTCAVFPGVGFQHTIAHYGIEVVQYTDVFRDAIEVVQPADFRVVLPDDFDVRTVEQLISVRGSPKVTAPVFVLFDLHGTKLMQFVFPLFVGDIKESLPVPRAL